MPTNDPAALIAEARCVTSKVGQYKAWILIHQLADALEAALRERDEEVTRSNEMLDGLRKDYKIAVTERDEAFDAGVEAAALYLENAGLGRRYDHIDNIRALKAHERNPMSEKPFVDDPMADEIQNSLATLAHERVNEKPITVECGCERATRSIGNSTCLYPEAQRTIEELQAKAAKYDAGVKAIRGWLADMYADEPDYPCKDDRRETLVDALTILDAPEEPHNTESL